ncbi:MAG: class II aldolase/adducin family protein [Roseovarius sp.]|nr:class II aldolase/adducin family protein [Roseovarius sp.]
MRPSIEAGLHAAFPQKVFVHVHCVNTPAHAVRRDAEKILSTRLAGYRWTCIPYVKTGAKLAISVMNKWISGCNVVVPGNHVLVVVGETVMARAFGKFSNTPNCP